MFLGDCGELWSVLNGEKRRVAFPPSSLTSNNKIQLLQ